MTAPVADTLETRQARLDAAIAVQEPDRVPYVHKDLYFPGLLHAGMTAEEVLFNPERAEAALVKVFEECGRAWDAIYRPEARSQTSRGN